MSCGRTPSPPNRAMVSAIRLPVTAFMLAETTGWPPPGKSDGVRSTLGPRRTVEVAGVQEDVVERQLSLFVMFGVKKAHHLDHRSIAGRAKGRPGSCCAPPVTRAGAPSVGERPHDRGFDAATGVSRAEASRGDGARRVDNRRRSRSRSSTSTGTRLARWKTCDHHARIRAVPETNRPVVGRIAIKAARIARFGPAEAFEKITDVARPVLPASHVLNRGPRIEHQPGGPTGDAAVVG